MAVVISVTLAAGLLPSPDDLTAIGNLPAECGGEIVDAVAGAPAYVVTTSTEQPLRSQIESTLGARAARMTISVRPAP
jgi:hypothetical protein